MNLNRMRKDSDMYFGFSTFQEVAETALGFKNKSMQLAQLFILFIGTLSLFVDAYIFHPYQQYYTIVGLLIADNISGILVGVFVKKEGFLTTKAQRFILLFIGYSAAMIGAFYMAQVAYFYSVIPHVIFYYLSSVLFLSCIKNISMLGWLPKGINLFLKKYIDRRKDEMVDAIGEQAPKID
jgi:hypothetical protein